MDVAAVDVDGSDETPSTPTPPGETLATVDACPEPLVLELDVDPLSPLRSPSPTALAPAVVDDEDGVALPCDVHALPTLVVGDRPADASAVKQEDPEGDPPPPLPPVLFAEALSDADDGPVPQLVPRLASVGTPGDASAVEHVDALVGS